MSMASALFSFDFTPFRKYVRENQRHVDRPIFIFPCGGEEGSHHSRKRVREYVHRRNGFQNIFCLTAEDIAKERALDSLNLLEQEALLADICDCIIIFAESVGSFCELGAFTALPHASAITAVAVDKKHRGEHSYILDGPVKHIEQGRQPLNQVFYVDLENPFSSASFTKFISDLRANVRESLTRSQTKDRKKFNTKESEIMAGSLVHELLDILQLFGPLTKGELEYIYCEIKNFKYKYDNLKIKSEILMQDMKKSREFSLTQILSMMRATGLVEVLHDSTEPLSRQKYSARIHLESYYMFSNTDSPSFSNLRASFILKRRNVAKRERYW